MNAAAIAKRWREREQRWVSPGDVFRPAAHAVDIIGADGPAKRFVVEHHYAGTYPAAVCRVGLFGPGAHLVGVAVFSVGMNHAAAARKYSAVAPNRFAELGRFVCLPSVAYNGETWFLARAFRFLLAEKGITTVLSFADPVERCAGGIVVKPQHWGTIYQASNALYVGRSDARMHLIAPDGRTVSPRLLSKIRAQDQGAAYAERQLLTQGAPGRRFGEEPRAWVERVTIAPGFARVRHPGNLAYLFGLDVSAREQLRAKHGAGLMYVKRSAA